MRFRVDQNSRRALNSRLQEWKLLEKDTKITSTLKRQKIFSDIFRECENLSYCADIVGAFNKLGIPLASFHDGSLDSLKAELLDNENFYPALPIAHSPHMKESYKNFKGLLEKVNYKNFM